MTRCDSARPAGHRTGRRNTDSTRAIYHDQAAEKLLSRLDAVRQTGPDRWIARCPAHDDRQPSLSVREDPDGKLLLHCFGGCGAGDVVGAVGLSLADLFPPHDSISYDRPPKRRGVHRWPAADVLRCLASDASRLAIMARDWAVGRDLDYSALVQTAGRIAAAADLAQGVRR